MRRIICLTLAIVSSCIVVLAATLLAQASSPLRLGWVTPQMVSPEPDSKSLGPRMAVDDAGHIHLIWMDDEPGQPDLYYIKSGNQGNSWSGAQPIATTAESYQGSLALGGGGTVHACWWEFAEAKYNLLYAQRSAAGWSLEETVVVTDSDIQEPSIAQAGNYVHVIWSNKLQPDLDLFYSSRKLVNGSGWLTPTVIVDTEDSSLYGRLAADTYGNLHLVWQENISPTNEIMYISATVGAGQTTWFSPITVTAGLSPGATTPDIVVGDGVVHIAFGVDVPTEPDIYDIYDVYYARFPISDTENISPTVIPGSTVTVSQQLPTYASPSLALDGSDNVHAVWNGIRGTDNSDRIYYAMSEDQGASWSQPVAISPPGDDWADGFPTIGTDGTLVHVAWQQKGLGDSIYYVRGFPIITYFSLGLKDYS